MARFVRSYSNLLKRYPLTTQSITTGILMGTGDILAQTVVEKQPINQVNLVRTVPYAAIGLVVGPTVGIWYRFLEYKIGKEGIPVVLKKIAMDQIIFAPCFLAALVSSLDYARGNTISEVKENLRNKYVDIVLTNYKVWPFVQLVNFYFVPLHYRVILVQSVAVLWNTYLSWKINKPSTEEIKTVLSS